MNSKFFNRDVEPACEYCSHGRKSRSSEEILCIKKGVMPLYGKCIHYRYDPLRRTPKPKPSIGKYSADDFKL